MDTVKKVLVGCVVVGVVGLVVIGIAEAEISAIVTLAVGVGTVGAALFAVFKKKA